MTDFADLVRHPAAKLGGLAGGFVTVIKVFAIDVVGAFAWFNAESIFTIATLLTTASGSLGIPEDSLAMVVAVSALILLARIGFQLLQKFRDRLGIE